MMLTWMSYAMLVAACAAVAAMALEPLARARSLKTRWVWVSALVASFIIPVAMAVRPMQESAMRSLTSSFEPASLAASATDTSAALVTVDSYLGLGWLFASGAMLLVVVSGVVQLRRSRSRGDKAQVGGASVALTPDVGPGAIWFGEPRIVLPRWVCSLGEASASLLVRHEVEHVRAGDPMLLAIGLGALVVAPWNLPLWFITRRLRAAIEIDCDARVLAAGGDVRAYGELLLTVAARRNARAALHRSLIAILPFAEPATPLERRIRAMTDRTPRLSLTRRIAMMAIAGVAILAACEARRPDPVAPVTTFSVHNDSVKSSGSMSTEQAETLKQKLAQEMAMRVPDSVLAGNPNDPLLVVYSSKGTLLMTKRLSKESGGAGGVPINPNAILTVDVAKGPSAALTPETKGGIIRVVIKPDAENSPDVWTSDDTKQRLALPSSDARPKVTSDKATDERTAVRDAELSERKETAAARIMIYDANGALVRDLPAGTKVESYVDSEQIARVDVNKPILGDGAAEVHVYLKPGVSLKK